MSRIRPVQNRGSTRHPRGLSYTGQNLREEIWGWQLPRRRALAKQEEQSTTGRSLFAPLHLSQNPSEFPSKQTQTDIKEPLVHLVCNFDKQAKSLRGLEEQPCGDILAEILGLRA